MNNEAQLMKIILEQEKIQAKYPNMKLLFHGTNLENAQSMRENLNSRVSNTELAKDLCSRFSATLEEVISDPHNYGFFEDFVFADTAAQSREKFIYTTTSLELAASYASRGPEWRYHLLMHFASKELGLPFSPLSHHQEVEDWISAYAQTPGIVILDASKYPEYPVRSEISRKLNVSDTVVLSYPFPEAITVLESFEWYL